VAHMGEERMCIRFWSESQNERDPLEDKDVDRIRMDIGETGWVYSGSSWLRIGTGRGTL
jgi:hypothetical protein